MQFYFIILNLLYQTVGLETKVLNALYDLVKEKGMRIHFWKEVKGTRTKWVKKHYLKVIILFAV